MDQLYDDDYVVKSEHMQYNIYCISGRQTRCNIVVIVWDVIEYYTKKH